MKTKTDCRYHSGIPTASPMMCDCKPQHKSDSVKSEAHTPTPWKETEGARDSEFNYISGPKGQLICELDISHPEQQANAAFIVRCVNSHESLKAFLKAFVDYENAQEASPVNLVMDAQKLLNKLEADK